MVDSATAQFELRDSYVHGGPGAVVSGFVWLAASITASKSDISTGFTVLFLGGILIYPVATMIVRFLFHRAPPPKDNPGGRTVVETIFPMMGGLLAAWLLIPHRPEFVFPMAAIAVGAHYFGFRTAYGDSTYWVLASAICLVGVTAIFVGVPTKTAVPYIVAAIEIAFGLWLTWSGMNRNMARTLSGSDQGLVG